MATLKATVRQPQRLTASVYKYLSHSHPLSELTQSGAADKDVIKWDQALGQWKVGRVQWDEIGSAGAGNDGEITFWNSGSLASTSNLFWDNTNTILKISNTLANPKIILDSGEPTNPSVELLFQTTQQPKARIYSDLLYEYVEIGPLSSSPYIGLRCWGGVNSGKVSIGNTLSPSAKLSVVGERDIVQLLVKANATQTQDLVQVLDSASNPLVIVDANGKVGIGTNTISSSYMLQVEGNIGVGSYGFYGTWFYGQYFGTYAYKNTNTYVRTQAGYGIVFQEGTTTKMKINSGGRVDIGSNTYNDAKLHIEGETDEVQLLVKANATQTENVVEIQDAGGTLLFSIGNNGSGYFKYYLKIANMQIDASAGLYHVSKANNKIYPHYSASTEYMSGVPDGASAIAHQFYTSANLATAGAKLASWQNGSVEKAFLSHEGEWVSRALASPTITLGANQFVFYLDEANNKLKVQVKYSDGTTVKVGEIALI